jgi:septal ring-binding cell division protein DamX
MMKLSKAFALVSLLVAITAAIPISGSSINSSEVSRFLTKQIHLERRKSTKGTKETMKSSKSNKKSSKQSAKALSFHVKTAQSNSSPLIGDTTYANRRPLPEDCEQGKIVTIRGDEGTLSNLAVMNNYELSSLILSNKQITDNKLRAGDEVCVPSDRSHEMLTSSSESNRSVLSMLVILVSLV